MSFSARSIHLHKSFSLFAHFLFFFLNKIYFSPLSDSRYEGRKDDNVMVCRMFGTIFIYAVCRALPPPARLADSLSPPNNKILKCNEEKELNPLFSSHSLYVHFKVNVKMFPEWSFSWLSARTVIAIGVRVFSPNFFRVLPPTSFFRRVVVFFSFSPPCTQPVFHIHR